jgi:ketosteroid isomerase-like protein
MGKQRDSAAPSREPEEAPVETSETAPDRAPSLTRELRRVEEANLAFYDAFHSRDIEKMSQVWSHSPHARCVHPGWELVIGWPDIRQSWADIFRTIQEIDFRLEEIHIEVSGRTAWANLVAHVSVSTDEGESFQATVVTTNIFEEVDERWSLVLHHSSNFAEEEELEEDEIDIDNGMEGGGFAGAN